MTHYELPGGTLELIANIKAVSALDDPKTNQSRYDAVPGDLAHNFIGGQPVLVTPARTEWVMLISHINGAPVTRAKYTTQALRNTAITTITTALTT